ncbi:MAG TPA: hypothetical protein VKP66_13825 [Steroidobacteraceae bacterium]|nr:hypothetical protein [Steroidobacteraceae bacterium]
MNVGITLGHFLTDRFGEIAHRIGGRFGDRKVFLECDLALHFSFSRMAVADKLILTRALLRASCAEPRLTLMKGLGFFEARSAFPAFPISGRGISRAAY